MNLQPGMTLYYLNRDCYNPNEIEQLIVPLTVTQHTEGYAATSEMVSDTQVSLPLTPQQMVQYMDERFPVLFNEFADAKIRYDSEINAVNQRISTLNKEELIQELNVWKKPIAFVNEDIVKELYQTWIEAGSALPNQAEVEVVKKRIAELFNVTL